MMNKT